MKRLGEANASSGHPWAFDALILGPNSIVTSFIFGVRLPVERSKKFPNKKTAFVSTVYSNHSETLPANGIDDARPHLLTTCGPFDGRRLFTVTTGQTIRQTKSGRIGQFQQRSNVVRRTSDEPYGPQVG